MNQFKLFAAGALLALVFSAAPARAAGDAAAEKAVWAMEETYWKTLESSDLQGYVSLWHKDFLGWPRDRDLPVGKDGIEEGTRKKMAAGKVARHEILSKSVRIVGGVGITQYAVKVFRVENGGDTLRFTSRVTHTWLKTGKTWQIIGGMSAPIESSQHTF